MDERGRVSSVARVGPAYGTGAGPEPVDVLVVGGGLTGLATAFWVTRLEPGARVVLLEAAERAGGKASTLDVGGFSVDTGPGTLVLEPEGAAPLLEAPGRQDAAVAPAPAVCRRG